MSHSTDRFTRQKTDTKPITLITFYIKTAGITCHSESNISVLKPLAVEVGGPG